MSLDSTFVRPFFLSGLLSLSLFSFGLFAEIEHKENETQNTINEANVFHDNEQKNDNDPVKTNEQVNSDMLKKILGGASSDDVGKMLESFVEFLEQSRAKKHNEMLSKIKEYSNELYEKFNFANAEYGRLVEFINIKNILIEACKIVQNEVEKIKLQEQKQEQENKNKNEQEKKNTLLNDISVMLEKLHKALITGEFGIFLQEVISKNTVGMDSGGINKTFIPPADLVILNETFKEFIEKHGPRIFPSMKKEHFVLLELFKCILIAAQNCSLSDIANLTFTFLQPKFKEVRSILEDICKRFETVALELGVSLDSESDKNEQTSLLSKAIEYWYKIFKKCLQTLGVFDSLTKNADLKSNGRDKSALFNFIANAYEFGNQFFDLYKIDQKEINELGFFDKGLFLPMLGDWALRVGISSFIFFDVHKNICKNAVCDTLQGKEQLSGMDFKKKLLYYAMTLPSIAPFFIGNPRMFDNRSHPVTEGFIKVLTAWAYYGIFRYNMFYDKEIFKNNDIWPAYDKHVKNALYVLLNAVTVEITDTLEAKVRNVIGIESLEKLENFSLGIVRPEFINFFARTLLPTLFLHEGLKEKGIMNFSRKDVYGENFKNEVEKKFSGIKFESNETDKCYIQKQLLNYVFSSIGWYGGRKIFKNYKGILGKGLAKGVDFIAKGLMYTADAGASFFGKKGNFVENYDEFKNEMDSEIEEMIDLIKLYLELGFTPESPIRPYVVGFLMEHGYIAKDETDDNKINFCIISIVLNQLSRSEIRVFSPLEAAKIVKIFVENPHNVGIIIDEIIDGIQKNFVGMIGGRVCEYFMGLTSNYIFKTHGPFFIKN
jgi:hypothetical protein